MSGTDRETLRATAEAAELRGIRTGVIRGYDRRFLLAERDALAARVQALEGALAALIEPAFVYGADRGLSATDWTAYKIALSAARAIEDEAPTPDPDTAPHNRYSEHDGVLTCLECGARGLAAPAPDTAPLDVERGRLPDCAECESPNHTIELARNVVEARPEHGTCDDHCGQMAPCTERRIAVAFLALVDALAAPSSAKGPE